MKKIKVKMYRDMPNPVVELDSEDLDAAKGGRDETLTVQIHELDWSTIHNQSFGMVSASMGCSSTPTGPGC